MNRLSDTQLVILKAAVSREDRMALPLPSTIRGGAAQKTIGSMLKAGLIEERRATISDPVWRDAGDHAVTLVATDAAFAALGVDPNEGEAEDAADAADVGVDSAQEAPVATSGATEPTEAHTATSEAATSKKERTPRENSKQAQLIEMLRRPDGASLDEIVAATGWQPHTVRGAIAGALKKKLGLAVTSEKVENRGRVYRIV